MQDLKQLLLKYAGHKDRVNLFENWFAPDCETKRDKILAHYRKSLIDNQKRLKKDGDQPPVEVPEETGSNFLICTKERMNKFNARFEKMISIYLNNCDF